MVDIDDPKQQDETQEPTTVTASSSVNAQLAVLEDVSKRIEVLLHASEAPLTAHALKKHLSLSTKALKQALDVLQQRLDTGVLTLHETASGYRLQISDDYSSLIQRIFPQRQERLSQALLETLSVIAYKQPVTRSDIEQVRGVTLSSNILRQLFDKGWIVEKGFKDTLGRPALLHTTAQFLDAFGLSHLDELPPMPDMDAIRAMS
ncbi:MULTISPECIES: SMC-Scp complex subunit ScpB [unclassified Psychrobacter]|uniref:SMC-Scp complex subunit ScpB n=1 Tax=unclassified Psychrobacter TaxID=196806 RepID=UPI0025B36C10|nr:MULTISPECIES: SMC-Scp complex subunit ScpB [unclassified Psychrobacter]MDN3453449.1 SMC-Scp complex subunit ScpB [Psychrobacter sp. APC 3350]MDN3501978.1 SMC-Scp complex subunit ScpB [Psychrobacter sp. 5A.1]